MADGSLPLSPLRVGLLVSVEGARLSRFDEAPSQVSEQKSVECFGEQHSPCPASNRHFMTAIHGSPTCCDARPTKHVKSMAWGTFPHRRSNWLLSH